MTMGRICGLILKVVLLAGLMTWVAAAPLVWILRDGLAPGMVETSGVQAVIKFAVGWGVPALTLVVPLLGIILIERYLARTARAAQEHEE